MTRTQKPKEKLTERTIKGLKVPTEGNRIHYDKEIPGFGVRITPNGAISFVLNYRIHGRERRYTIGRHPEINASASRAEALNLRQQIQKGEDPLSARVNERGAPTVRDLAEDYLSRYAVIHKRALSIRDDRYMLRGVILPKIARLKVTSVERRDIENLHHSFKATPYRANRVLSLLSKMFSLAVEWKWRPDNPVRGIPRYLEDKRERWLSTEELRRLLKALEGHPDQLSANAIRLLILTGARKTEVLAATWDHFDLERAVWTKPSHHTKQKRPEHFPLGSTTTELLLSMKRKSEGEYLFPGRIPEEPLKDLNKFWKHLCRKAKIPNARINDLRHTYASHLVSSGLSLPLIGKLLGHTQPQTTARYAHLADSSLREATNQFGTMYQTIEKKKVKQSKK